MESTEETATTASGGGGGLRKPLIITATLAAAAGLALGAKSFLESRRDRGGDEDEDGEQTPSDEDLATTLRRAALDVAIAATNEAAERLSAGDKAEKQSESR